MTITFCGHSEIYSDESISYWLSKIIEEMILQGADLFLLGGYGHFDRMAASAVWKLKKQYPHIESVLVLPYFDNKLDRALYDSTIYPSLEKTPRRFAISHQNRWMVDNSDVVVAYVLRSWGGAATTLAYAKRKHKTIRQYSVDLEVHNEYKER